MRLLAGALAVLFAAGCARSFPGNPHNELIVTLLALRMSAPRYAYVTVPATNTIFSFTVDTAGALTQTGSFVQATSPSYLAPDPAGRFLHFQTSAAAFLHWRTLGANGVPTSGSSLAATSSAILVRSVVFPSYMIGLVQGGGSSLQSYPLNADGSVTAPQTGMEAGTNYSSMAQHPTLPLLYILENAGAAIRVSQMSANGTYSFRTSVATTAASAIAVDPQGRYLVTANPNAASNLMYYSLDSAGIPTAGPVITAGLAATAHLAFDSTGTNLYVLRQTAGTNLTVVKMSTFSVIAAASSGNTPTNFTHSLLVENSGRFLYAAGAAPAGVALVSLVTGTPVLTTTYNFAGSPTIGLYHTTRCVIVPDQDC